MTRLEEVVGVERVVCRVAVGVYAVGVGDGTPFSRRGEVQVWKVGGQHCRSSKHEEGVRERGEGRVGVA